MILELIAFLLVQILFGIAFALVGSSKENILAGTAAYAAVMVFEKRLAIHETLLTSTSFFDEGGVHRKRIANSESTIARSAHDSFWPWGNLYKLIASSNANATRI